MSDIVELKWTNSEEINSSLPSSDKGASRNKKILKIITSYKV